MSASVPGPAAPRTATPRVGVIGADVPRQLVLAAGATPVRIFGSWSQPYSSEAAELLGAVDAVAARILDEVLSGAHDDLAGLVVCNDSAADLRIFYVLRILSERGRVPFPVHLLDAPRDGGAPRDRFVGRQYDRLVAFCESLTGERIDAAGLRLAARRERELGRALTALRARRRARECSGAAALHAYVAAATLPPEHAMAIVDDAASADARDGEPVFVTGSAHPEASVYRVIEAAGLVVVGEDHDTADAAWIGDAVDTGDRDEAVGRLAQRHAARPPLAARSRTRERAAELERRLAETDASGVLALVRELDDGPVWDLPGQRAVAERRGLPIASRARIAPEAALVEAEEVASALAGELAAAGQVTR
ncbi:2-hydroxyacyl-CoA dehydratase family protein [Agromyces sp. H66]|uniref:2-hydroxyacyl-CoA dehydratase family protein n=1 Tax=Agromyces sp. H66 TaxID=2529859 RepID=UPI00145B7FCB|nr:2-hydroxyacyl-CoA dehydratase family protein [Agromyces sp. H66]